MPNEVRTGKVRFSYAHVFEPKTPKGSTVPKYSSAIIIEKTDKATLTALKKAIDAAIEYGTEKKWGGKKPPSIQLNLHDGDKERPGDSVYAGCYFLNAKSDRQPGIVDNGTPPVKITDPNEFYSGCYGRAFFTAYPYDFMGKKGIGYGLQHVQFLEHGERLAGGVSVDDAFDDWGGTADNSVDDLPF